MLGFVILYFSLINFKYDYIIKYRNCTYIFATNYY